MKSERKSTERYKNMRLLKEKETWHLYFVCVSWTWICIERVFGHPYPLFLHKRIYYRYDCICRPHTCHWHTQFRQVIWFFHMISYVFKRPFFCTGPRWSTPIFLYFDNIVEQKFLIIRRRFQIIIYSNLENDFLNNFFEIIFLAKTNFTELIERYVANASKRIL